MAITVFGWCLDLLAEFASSSGFLYQSKAFLSLYKFRDREEVPECHICRSGHMRRAGQRIHETMVMRSQSELVISSTSVVKVYRWHGTHQFEVTHAIPDPGGWSSEDPTVFGKDQLEQIDWAFRNIELALKDSGALMKDVFKVVSYHKSLNEQSFERTVDNFKRYMPNHKPLWTCVQVENLAVDKMEVEIEVIACCPT